MKYGIWHRSEGRYIYFNDDLERTIELCRYWNGLNSGYPLYEVQKIDDSEKS